MTEENAVLSNGPEESPFIHPQGICESQAVGGGTRIWAFAHVLPGAQIGRDCNICDYVFIENDVVVGDAVTIKCGVQLWDGVRLGDRVFVGPNATFTNDRFPRSKIYPETFSHTIVEDDASIGANATILPGVSIGRSAMIGAGTVVTRDVPAYATVVGNPGRIVGYQDNVSSTDGLSNLKGIGGTLGMAAGSRLELGVGRCFLERLPHFGDMRGNLTPLEIEKGMPFVPRRVFLVHGVPSHHVRGEHAHHRCEQFLVAANGSLSVVVDDGRHRQEVRLTDRSIGLYLAPMVWGIQYKFSADCVLMVAASHVYEAADYIRDYGRYRELV